ncbi:alpha/beta hydrolase [Donghicola sp.]|jgi:pimeloyl-ACP methyl ester carboxylesterase|uniref:alpha/beta fold hydrolase n=1 Tax=Donghicola sp. TaxID=1929294 RepID=UPI0025FFB0E8|nr:alpha/beta hydrolase [Donghicola sp.]MCT4575875.1 alpha/beta hydrolase [Donghicola sp.]
MPRFDTSDGLSLHYTDQGDGLPVLCLPGLTRNGDDFQFVLPHLKGVRAITLDSRGRGLSEWDGDYMNYSIPREAADVVELCAFLGLERVVILGTSRGGLIAMGLAVTHPQLLQGVILNDIGPVIDEDGLDRIKDYVGVTPRFPDLETAAQTMAKAEAGGEFPNVPLSRWRAHAAAIYRQADNHVVLRYDPRLGDAMREQAKAGDFPDLWPFFDALKGKPVAVIRGANSDLLSEATVAEMSRRHGDLVVATVPDRGHVPFLDEPEALKAINAVLKSIRVPA